MNHNVLVARKQAGLTQEQLAAKVGVNHADVNRIEKHGWVPPAHLRVKFAEALNATEEQLFGAPAGA